MSKKLLRNINLEWLLERERGGGETVKKTIFLGVIGTVLVVLLATLAQAQLVEDEPVGVDKLMASLGVTSLPEGKIASGFTLKDLNGKEVSLSDYRGKLVFLNFWATWCPPCREEMPSMERLYQRFKDDEFVILAVDLRESKRVVEKFARKHKLNFPILLDSTGKTGDTYGVRAIPATYFINRQGELIGKAIGARDWASKKAFELIEHLLKE